MTQAAGDMIKLAAGAIVLLMTISIVFGGDDNMFVDSFKYMTYGEPLLLQRHIASMITTSSTLPGDYYGRIILTGEAYTLNFYKVEDTAFVSVSTKIGETRPDTQIEDVDPMPIQTKCYFATPTVVLQKDLSTVLNFRKTTDEYGQCALSFTVSN